MMRISRIVGLAVLCVALGSAPAPLSAQSSLRSLTTQELYALAREKAAKVTERCYTTSRTNYLEALSYLFAYYQVASRDGSLKQAPEFDRTIREQFTKVFRTADKCLDLLPNSSGSMRDDGTGARFEPPPPVYRVDLPDPPTPGTDTAAPATDAEGRTIPQLVAIIDGFAGERGMYRAEITKVEQQRDALAAELARLRSQPPTPPPPPKPANMSGEYRIQVKANGLFWHEDGNGDRKISTRYQPNDDFTRFIFELQPDGAYRIRVKADNRYLHAPGHADWTLSTLAQVDDDYTHFFLVPEPDGRSFKLRQKATGRYLGQGRDMLLTNGDELTDNDFIRFLLYR